LPLKISGVYVVGSTQLVDDTCRSGLLTRWFTVHHNDVTCVCCLLEPHKKTYHILRTI